MRKMNNYAFHEYNNARTNWRKEIDNNSIMKIINQEIAANGFKVSRWITQCLIGDIDYLNFALVVRKNIEDPSKGYQVLATHRSETKSWAKQLNIHLERGWRNIQHICAVVESNIKPEVNAGEYILMKEFNSM